MAGAAALHVMRAAPIEKRNRGRKWTEASLREADEVIAERLLAFDRKQGTAYLEKNAAEVARILLWPTSDVYEPL